MTTIHTHRDGKFQHVYGDDAVFLAKLLTLPLLKKSRKEPDVPRTGFHVDAADAFVSEAKRAGVEIILEQGQL